MKLPVPVNDREMAAGTYTDEVKKDYYDSIMYGITGAPTTFINDELYAMTGLDLVAAVKAILGEQRTAGQ